MGKLLPHVLSFTLCIYGSLQNEGGKRKRELNNSSEVVPPYHRSFTLDLVLQTKDIFVRNETQAPNSSISSQSPPTLQLLSNSTAVWYLQDPLSTRVIPVVYLLVVIVGIPANVVILYVVATNISAVPSAILICSLAVSDLLLLLSLLFKAQYHLAGNHWTLGEAACRLVTACFYGNLYCSAQTLASINMMRYLAVVHPFQFKGLSKRTYMTCVTVVVWGVFGAAVVPKLLVRQSYWIPELGRTTCHDVLPLDLHSHAFLLYYNLGLTILGLLVPLVVTVFCYSRIFCKLNQSHSMYIKASSLVFVLFVLCFTPAGLLDLVHYAKGTDSFKVYFKVAVCLCCLHASLDPFLSILMSKYSGSNLYYLFFKGKTVSISI